MLLAGPASARCVGDCDGGGTVTVEELVRGVGIALGDRGTEQCPPFDRDVSGAIEIAELVAAVGAGLEGCPPLPASFCGDRAGEVETRIDTLLAEMTLAEKVAQMHGSGPLPSGGVWPTADNERLGIPGFRFVDGMRGVARTAGNATAFPVGMARGATWDPELEERVGRAMALEARAKGANALLAPTVNVLRHPLWGRAQETYGEDPLHIGRMATAFVRGVQTEVAASVKHFAVNSIENTREEVDVQIDERTLREVYLPQFRAAVRDGHAATVMTAYNSVNGRYCSENPHLLRAILKNDWGFTGLVESDWLFAVHSTAASAAAGLDLEMPVAQFYGQPLQDAVENGTVPESTVDEAVRRILRVKLCFGLDQEREPVDSSVVESLAHRQLAREVAAKSIVLLKNQGILPLPAGSGSVALVGPLTDSENIGDEGSSAVMPSAVVTVRAGMQAAIGAERVVHVPGVDPSPAEWEAIAGSNTAVVVVGLTSDDEGEARLGAGDRSRLRLTEEEESLIAGVAVRHPRTVVLLEGGSAIAMDPWLEEVEAVLMAWYPGQEGGHAIADVLFGVAAPSGRLPITFPRSLTDLPVFDNVSSEVEYGFLHGYRHLDAARTEPLFPFGFGLGYTTFAYSDLQLATESIAPDGEIVATLQVRNSGNRSGAETVQIYVGTESSSVERAEKDLRAFRKVIVEPGETRTLTFRIPATDLAYWNVDRRAWIVEPTAYVLRAGPHTGNLPLEAPFRIVSRSN